MKWTDFFINLLLLQFDIRYSLFDILPCLFLLPLFFIFERNEKTSHHHTPVPFLFWIGNSFRVANCEGYQQGAMAAHQDFHSTGKALDDHSRTGLHVLRAL
jgi:hypothetical protein